jgi:2'-5' RNA ligase
VSPRAAGVRTKLRNLRLALRRSDDAVSTLVVAVPEAELLYEAWDGDHAQLGVPGLPPHVTVLYPFLPASGIDSSVERDLETIAQSHEPFDYALSTVGRFPGVLYVAPSPGRRFVELTESIHANWPKHPPYRGLYEQIVPHLTLALGEEPLGLVRAVEAALPVGGIARELILMVNVEDGTWVEQKRFALGYR